MRKKIGHSLGSVLGLLLFVSAILVLHRELSSYHLHDIIRYVRSIPLSRLSSAVILTLLNYTVMTGYDALALRHIRHPLSYGRVALASFTGYAFSNNVGLSMIAGASIRFRLYSLWGLSTLEIAKVVAFCVLTLWLGFFTLGGLVFVIEPLALPGALHLPFASVRLLGVSLLLTVAVILSLSILGKRHFKLRGRAFSLPSPGILLAQTGIAVVDWTLAGLVLYVLLPALPELSFARFLGFYLLAQLAGLISQVPGGLGVFETVALVLLSAYLPAPKIIGILIAYRAIYYILPFGMATVLLGTEELLVKKQRVEGFVKLFGQWASGLLPEIIALTMFLGGAILIFSGATPAVGWRLTWLEKYLPLPALEISHFLGSITGMGLLVLARGLQRRLDSAYVLTVVLLVAGIVFSMLKGLDYEETAVLLVMLGVILPCRRQFYRKAALLGERFTIPWIVSIMIVLISSVWLGIFSYKHIEYTNDLWWRFAFSDDAPRFLRATVGVLVFAMIFAIARLTRPVTLKHATPGRADIELAAAIVRKSPRTYAYLALLGDKSFLFNEHKNAFIMYGIEGRSWVAMGDPVGPVEEWMELVWKFNELCDRYGGWTIFYEIEPRSLHLYLDLGLTLLKIGEEALVPLEDFTLRGGRRKALRHTLRSLERDGCSFEVVAAEKVPDILPELKAVSDGWLSGKNTREKGFSIGFFDAEYLKRCPAGIVRDRDGEIIAFANILRGADKEEISVDLMRYLPTAPQGVMEFLFLKLMLLGQQEGYRSFNLGMAPLSGLEARALAPLWNRFGAFIFHHGEHFYNFEGLRQYKNKFGPVWEPRYVASPGGLALPRIFANLSVLISRGIKGVVAK